MVRSLFQKLRRYNRRRLQDRVLKTEALERREMLTGDVSLAALGTLPLPDGAEISAFDPDTQRAFVTGDSLQIVDLSNPASPALLAQIRPTSYLFNNDAITSVAVARGIVAVALPDINKVEPGRVLLLNTDGGLLGSVLVGALPDMLTFTPDGTKLLVANEGEPERRRGRPTPWDR